MELFKLLLIIVVLLDELMQIILGATMISLLSYLLHEAYKDHKKVGDHSC